MQYIQLQGQVAAQLDLPIEGSYNLFIDTSDNSIKAKDSDGHMHGGGGLSLTELSRDEIGELISSASLTPGAFYKITGAVSQSFLDDNEFSWTGYGNEIQDGGTTIILQAATDATLSKKGIGLFYVPNYASHSVWDNTHQLDFNNLSGMFDHEEYVQLYSANEGTSTDAYLVANVGNNSLTIVYDNNNDTFLSDSTNLIDLTITGNNTHVSASITGYEYTSSYSEGNKVIWGGRVWENLNGNVGYKDGSWPNEQLTLNSADWTKVAFNEVDYTIVADLIEYEFEQDNISYRKGANNVEVTSTWKVWDDNWGYNMIKYFPWGHPNVQNVSISNSYLDSFVNYPDSSTASEIKFADYGGFNAHYWGRSTNISNISSEQGGHMVSLNLGYNTEIYNIKLGIESYISDIYTYDNDDGQEALSNITLGNNAQISDTWDTIYMYSNSYMDQLELDTDSYITDINLYPNSSIRDTKLGIGAYIGSLALENYATLRQVELTNSSRIQSMNMGISACFKRVKMGIDSYIEYCSIGENGYIKHIEMGDESYMYCNQVGDYSYFQYINLGISSYITNINQTAGNSNFEYIEVGVDSTINNVTLGVDCYINHITLGNNSTIQNINSSGATDSFVRYLNIENDTYFGGISMESYSNIQNMDIGTNVETGDIELSNGSSVNNFDIKNNSGFGGITLVSGSSLSNFELGQNTGFGGDTFTSSIDGITLSRGFNNYQANDHILGFTASFDPGVSWSDSGTFMTLNPTKSFQILDTTGWDASTSTLNYYLEQGEFDGQTMKFFMTSDGTNINGNASNLHIWIDTFASMDDFSGTIEQQPWYPFSQPNDYTQLRADIPQCIWLNGKWIIDNDAWD